MKQHSNSTVPQIRAAGKRHFVSLAILPWTLVAVGMLAGCKTQLSTPANVLRGQAARTSGSAAKTDEMMNLRAGDVLKISFPGSPSLDTTQTIRRDGKITMPLVGDVDAAGMTPSALESKLVDLYAPQISSKQVTVEVVNSSLTVYVTGMVLRPGKILSDHPLTALEAVMEAGGFDYTKANLKNVVVIRREGGVLKNFKVNMKAELDGTRTAPFPLKPDDIVYVPERFSIF
jgi:polysaccharide biosynthesis/export protein